MIAFAQNTPVYLYRDSVDFRKQINGLSMIVQEAMVLDPFAQALFVFTNRSRTRIKILYWQRNGFCLWLKRLEKDKFCWPTPGEQQSVLTLDGQQLHWLLDGFDIWKQPPHPTRHYAFVG
jgi:transposase